MYNNRAPDGTNNLCGKKLAAIRKSQSPRLSQRALADKVQLQDCDMDKNMIQRIESGQRFVTDIELRALAKALEISYQELLDD